MQYQAQKYLVFCQKGIAFSFLVWYNSQRCRGIVQLVEHQSPKLGVAGSSPSAPVKKKADCESNLLFSVIFACGE